MASRSLECTFSITMVLLVGLLVFGTLCSTAAVSMETYITMEDSTISVQVKEYIDRTMAKVKAEYNKKLEELNGAMLLQQEHFQSELAEMQAIVKETNRECKVEIRQQVRRTLNEANTRYCSKCKDTTNDKDVNENVQVSVKDTFKEDYLETNISSSNSSSGYIHSEHDLVSSTTGPISKSTPTATRHGHRAPSGLRRRDPVPIPGHQDKLSTNTIQRLTRQVSVQKVAFYAYVSAEITELGAHQDIVFDHVMVNIGNAYNGHHGVFVAPVAGTYVFSTTVHPNDNTAYSRLIVNNQWVAKMNTQKTRQVSQTVIVNLSVGDDVAVSNYYAGADYKADAHSTFSGFLLYQEASEEGPAIGLG